MPIGGHALSSEQPIKIAILAMGGEGGGVLADWIVSLAEASGYIGQSTSIPGVAQRTGATIYYVELFRKPDVGSRALPVLALMPMPGDVDIVLASELMEGARAVERGLVTADRTTLVTSTHRVYSIAEKSAMSDGRADSALLLDKVRTAAKRVVGFDMAAAAESTGSLVSAVLFGALCGTDVLPFTRAAFESTVARGGVGVTQSLRAFEIGCRLAQLPDGSPAAAPVDAQPVNAQPPAPRCAAVARLLARIDAEFPGAMHARIREGVRRLIDFQSPGYANLYLDRLSRVLAAVGDPAHARVVLEAARHLALWMSYEDTIRVADLKTRATRFQRVRGEVRVPQGQVLDIVEFMHPRIDEICDTLPAPIGRWLARPHIVNRLLARLTRRGRMVRTSSVGGFVLLYFLARWRVGRLMTLRHAVETQRIEAWLERIVAAAGRDVALAGEIVECQQLIKGYGETHRRGWQNFELLMQLVDRRPAALSAAELAELRCAALADEHGRKLREMLPPMILNQQTS